MVTLLQDHNCVPHVVVRKVNPEVGPASRSPLAPLHWSFEARQRRQERNPISLDLPQGGGAEVSLAPPSLAVLPLAMNFGMPRS